MPSLQSVVISAPTANVDYMYTIYLIDTSSNSVDLMLPSITGDGLHFYFRNTDTITSNIAIIHADTVSGNTIEGQISYQLKDGNLCHFVAFGTNWYLISCSDHAEGPITLSAPRFESGNLIAGSIGATGFENQDVLRLSHNIPDLSVYSNPTWIIGKQKNNHGTKSSTTHYENYSGVSEDGSNFYRRKCLEGVPVTNTEPYNVNGGRFTIAPTNVVPITVTSYHFQGLAINWWDWFTGPSGSAIASTDSQPARALAAPRGRRRSTNKSLKSVFLRAYIRVDNPAFVEGSNLPRWIYSDPSNEIVINNINGILRVNAVKAYSNV